MRSAIKQRQFNVLILCVQEAHLLRDIEKSRATFQPFAQRKKATSQPHCRCKNLINQQILLRETHYKLDKHETLTGIKRQRKRNHQTLRCSFECHIFNSLVHRKRVPSYLFESHLKGIIFFPLKFIQNI